MSPKLKNRWRSIVPLNLPGSGCFCIFPSADSSGYSPRETPVYLNVYDLTPINGYLYWAGIGVFHTGVEVHGIEYAFGAHDYPTSGVFEVEPRQCPGFKFRKSIFVGTTYMDPIQVRDFIEQQSAFYSGDTYQLVRKNCNHFCEDLCYRLTGRKIPKWVNRLARIGSVCNCVLPKALKASAVKNSKKSQGSDGEKNRLRNTYGFSNSHSISQEKEETISSLFLHSHYKGCITPWEPKISRNVSVKEE
ncbi:OLC1v1003153C1 [Oldenlandia corymbosa var. corymbosa]|nr:OLC1v1003153C1 [Oldenlandia corymbosa var. corymbosa]